MLKELFVAAFVVTAIIGCGSSNEFDLQYSVTKDAPSHLYRVIGGEFKRWTCQIDQFATPNTCDQEPVSVDYFSFRKMLLKKISSLYKDKGDALRASIRNQLAKLAIYLDVPRGQEIDYAEFVALKNSAQEQLQFLKEKASAESSQASRLKELGSENAVELSADLQDEGSFVLTKIKDLEDALARISQAEDRLQSDVSQLNTLSVVDDLETFLQKLEEKKLGFALDDLGEKIFGTQNFTSIFEDAFIAARKDARQQGVFLGPQVVCFFSDGQARCQTFPWEIDSAIAPIGASALPTAEYGSLFNYDRAVDQVLPAFQPAYLGGEIKLCPTAIGDSSPYPLTICPAQEQWPNSYERTSVELSLWLQQRIEDANISRSNEFILGGSDFLCNWNSYEYGRCFGSDAFIPISLDLEIPPASVTSLSSGFTHICFVENEKIICRGTSLVRKSLGLGLLYDFPILTASPRELHNTRNVFLVSDKTQFEQNTQVMQDFSRDREIIILNTHKQPSLLKAAGDYLCFVDDHGLNCLGCFHHDYNWREHANLNLFDQDVFGETIFDCPESKKINNYLPRNLIQPTLLATGPEHLCVKNSDGVFCYGNNSHGQLNVPANVRSPEELAAGDHHSCAIENSEIICWGDSSRDQTKAPIGLLRPHKLTLRGDDSCVFHDAGFSCWGPKAQQDEFRALVDSMPREWFQLYEQSHKNEAGE